MELKLEARKPRWWEKKWKPKKPILYILEYEKGEWINTYWWGGNWTSRSGNIRFTNSGTVRVIPAYGGPFDNRYHNWLVVGRSGTSLLINNLGTIKKIKSPNPKVAEWICFGEINDSLGILGDFTKKISKFNLEEKIKEHRI